MATSDNGYFTFNHSTFSHNYAIAGLIANLFSSATESRIENSNITSNIFIDSNTVNSEVTGT